MTINLQSWQQNLWKISFGKQLKFRWLIGLLLLGGIAGGGFGIYRVIAPSEKAQSQALTAQSNNGVCR